MIIHNDRKKGQKKVGGMLWTKSSEMQNGEDCTQRQVIFITRKFIEHRVFLCVLTCDVCVWFWVYLLFAPFFAYPLFNHFFYSYSFFLPLFWLSLVFFVKDDLSSWIFFLIHSIDLCTQFILFGHCSYDLDIKIYIFLWL